MKLLAGLAAAAFAAMASAATQESAEVYILQRTSPERMSDSTPELPRQLARHILLQRASLGRYPTQYASIDADLPHTLDHETAVSYISQYGRRPAPLFADASEPSQLVYMVEGTTTENLKPLKEKLSGYRVTPAFTVAEPPSKQANSLLFKNGFPTVGVKNEQCTFEELLASLEKGSTCWSSVKSSVQKEDARIVPQIITSTIEHVPALLDAVNSGKVEVTLVLMPESSRESKHKSWTDAAAGELRRRDETVLDDKQAASKATKTSGAAFGIETASNSALHAAGDASLDSHNQQQMNKPGSVPACFRTLDACTSGTNNCTGHGDCVNFSAGRKDAEAKDCFRCACKRTLNRPIDEHGEYTTKWAGASCEKKDVSTQFWLLAGFSIAIVGAISFAIGLLFQVGEEPLPGVIGAGVSRSK